MYGYFFGQLLGPYFESLSRTCKRILAHYVLGSTKFRHFTEIKMVMRQVTEIESVQIIKF
jgi:hypothetical protein